MLAHIFISLQCVHIVMLMYVYYVLSVGKPTDSIGCQMSCQTHGLVLWVVVYLPLFILLTSQTFMLILPLNDK